MNTPTKLEPCNVNVRTKISALWTSMLFVFAYVDLFTAYRPKFRAELDAGKIDGHVVDQSFLFATTVYIVVPSLMVFATLVLRPRASRITNLVLSVVIALSIVAAAVGEWSYYVLGSVVEVAQLAAIAYYAWTWPTEVRAASEPTRQPTAATRS